MPGAEVLREILPRLELHVNKGRKRYKNSSLCLTNYALRHEDV
jgi:hypothetical protein